MVLVTTVQVICAIMLRCLIMIVGQKQRTVGTLKKTILSPHLNKMALKWFRPTQYPKKVVAAPATVRTVQMKTLPVTAARKIAKARMRMGCLMIKRTSQCLVTKRNSSRKITTRRSWASMMRTRGAMMTNILKQMNTVTSTKPSTSWRTDFLQVLVFHLGQITLRGQQTTSLVFKTSLVLKTAMQHCQELETRCKPYIVTSTKRWIEWPRLTEA